MFDEARELAQRFPNFSFVPVLSEALASDDLHGAIGFVHRAMMQDLKNLSGWQVCACGVPLMVDAAQRDAVEECGLPETEFFSDAFVSRADIARLEAV